MTLSKEGSSGVDGKAILVTGCSSGLGLATAVHLAAGGFQVFATIRDLERRAALDAEAAKHNVRLEVLQLDVTDSDSVQAVVSHIIDQQGHIYGLVNNAGIALRGFFEDLTEEEIRRVFETNVFGTMAVTRAVLPHMRRAQQGRIVILTSVAGRQGTVALTGYCASKFALEGFGEALMQEIAPFNIQLSIIEPGITQTPIWERSIAKNALDQDSPYYTMFLGYRAVVGKVKGTATVTPEQVARTIARALTDRRPPLRYLIGWRPTLLFTLRRYLPDVLYDRLYTRILLSRVQREGARSLGAREVEL